MAIPHYKYPGEEFCYIRLSDIPEKVGTDNVREMFTKWMHGQTVPLVPWLEPQDAVYEWDWYRWCQGKLSGIEPLWDQEIEMADDKKVTEYYDSFSFVIDKQKMRIRYENETEKEVTVVFEPKEKREDTIPRG